MQEATLNTGLQTVEEATSAPTQTSIQQSTLPTTSVTMEERSAEEVAKEILSLQAQNIDVSTRTWRPEKVGEKKMMLFIGGGYGWVPSMNDPSAQVCLPYVEFLEGYLDEKQQPALRKWRMTCTRIVTMFLALTGSKEEGYTQMSYKYPLQTGWQIEFVGTVASKKNPNHKIMDFAIRVPQKSLA